jgi:hypothetical protein
MTKIFNLKVAALIGFFQGLGLAGFGFFVLISAFLADSIERMSTLITEVILYVFLGIIVLLISRGLKNFKRLTFTPFLLTQLFVIIIGWPLTQDDQQLTRVLGFLMILFSAYSLITGLLPVNRKKFL